MLGSRNVEKTTRKGIFTIINVNALKEHMFAFAGLSSSVCSLNYPELGSLLGGIECQGLHEMELSWVIFPGYSCLKVYFLKWLPFGNGLCSSLFRRDVCCEEGN